MSPHDQEPPIACSLPPAESSDRRAVWERLLERALREQQLIPRGVRLVFVAAHGVEGELRELARLEALCCSFADWTVHRGDGEVVLEVTAPPEAVGAVRALFDRVLPSET